MTKVFQKNGLFASYKPEELQEINYNLIDSLPKEEKIKGFCIYHSTINTIIDILESRIKDSLGFITEEEIKKEINMNYTIEESRAFDAGIIVALKGILNRRY